MCVGRGRTNREAADELSLSTKTVDSHLQRIYRKLGVRSRSELAVVVTRALGREATSTRARPDITATLEAQPAPARLRGFVDPLAAVDPWSPASTANRERSR